MPDTLTPKWPAPPGVRAAQTTRAGGVSAAPCDTLNLGDHVGDDPAAVEENRRLLSESLSLPGEPSWLEQVHGNRVLELPADADRRADAAVTTSPGQVLAVLTADCLPVLFATRDGGAVGIAHAGWRGLAAGVLENTLAALTPDAGNALAWLGPCIGPAAFEVGPEVRAAFCDLDADAAASFVRGRGDRWLADLHGLARRRLQAAGLRDIHALADACTFRDERQYYSYRRDGTCGRMASLIWLEAPLLR